MDVPIDEAALSSFGLSEIYYSVRPALVATTSRLATTTEREDGGVEDHSAESEFRGSSLLGQKNAFFLRLRAIRE